MPKNYTEQVCNLTAIDFIYIFLVFNQLIMSHSILFSMSPAFRLVKFSSNAAWLCNRIVRAFAFRIKESWVGFPNETTVMHARSWIFLMVQNPLSAVDLGSISCVDEHKLIKAPQIKPSLTTLNLVACCLS